jgi:CBS domain-containing protein
MEAPESTTGNGDLVLATGANGAQNRIVFAAGGLSSDNTQMTITPDESVRIVIDTASTSPSTGALVVDGGVGIQGDVNIQGNITFGGAGTSLTTENLAVTDPLIFVGDGNASDAVDMGLIAEYKESSTTKYAGIVRDASDGVFKLFEDATTKPTSTVNFSEAGLGYGDLRVDEITAASAVITNITIGTVDQTEIAHLNGVTSAIQTQLDDKSTASKTETLTNKTIDGANNTITNVAISTGVSGLGTGVATFLATPSSANLASAVTDETGTGALVFANTPTLVTPELGAATGTSIAFPDALAGSATATAGTSATTIDTWSATTYSAAKYFVQMKKDNDIEVIEMLVAVDGNNNVYVTEYGNVVSNVELGTTNAVYSGGNVLLQVTAAAAGTSVKVSKTYIEA